MKILRVVYDWPPPWKGLAPGPFDLTVAQQKLGHQVTVFCGGWPRRQKECPEGVNIKRLPSGLIPGLNLSVYLFSVPSVLLYYWFYRLIGKSFDLIHAHGHLSMFLSLWKMFFGWLDKTPYVVHFHNVAAARAAAARKISEVSGSTSEIKELPPLTTRFEWMLHKLADRLAVKSADKLIAVSESMKRELIKWYDAPPEKIVVLENGVNTRLFSPHGQVIDLGWRNKKILLFVGSLSSRKNPGLLIKALPHLPDDYAALLIGDGPMENELHKLARELKVDNRVKLTGFIPNRQLPKYFRAVDLFVLPSSYEGFPKVILEALACGLPVVASGFDPGPEFDGMIFTPEFDNKDSRSWVSIVEKVVEGKVKVNREFIEKHYSWAARAAQLDKTYAQIS